MSSLLGIGGGGNVGSAGGSFYPYLIDQSLRFNSADSAYISYNPTTTSNQKTWTISLWVKRSGLGTNQSIFTVGTSANGFEIRFNTDDTIIIQSRVSSSNRFVQDTDDKFRDVGAFYHIVYMLDTTQVTNTDRAKLWVNGRDVALTQFTANTLWPTKDQNQRVNFAGDDFQFGISRVLSAYTNAYLAEINFVDGANLQATDFGETINGVWVPKAYSGSYGTNGFYLSFADSSAIGDDLSGNTNDFTANNINVHDVVPDSPTNNFATMNPLDQEQQGSNINTTIRGNLDVKSQGNTGYGKTRATFAIPTSGKWYWEMRCTNTTGQSMGILNSSADLDNTDHFDAFAEGYSYRNDGKVKNNGTSATYGDSWTNLDNIGVLVDADAGEIFFYKNGTIQNSGTAAFTGLDMSNNYMPIWADRSTSANGRAIFNFGQDSTFYGGETAGGNSDANGNGDFQYTVPTGALALCSANLPEPAIGPNSGVDEQSDDYFNTVLYTGTGATQSITGVNFQSDFTWIKSRSSAYNNVLWDIVRGATKQLSSNTTGAESTQAQGLTSFDSDGFTLGTNSNINNSGSTFVAWNWKAGGTAVSNTNGSITSQVSANQDAGFSIVTWVGNNTDGATVGHGLTDPEFSIVKNRDSGTNWDVCWSGFTSGTSLNLDTTAAEFSPTTGYQQLGTSTITLKNGGSGIGRVNGTPDDYVAYVFKSVDGYSKVGSYVGNGNADGTFVYTGFRPAFLLVKRTDGAYSWSIFDAKRFDPYPDRLAPDLSDAESVGGSVFIDFLSNGFKWRATLARDNASGGSYIYLAFAEAPFKYSLAR